MAGDCIDHYTLKDSFSDDQVRLISILVKLQYVYLSIYFVSGVARGIGWQQIGTYINLGAYYLVGSPVGVVLAFVFHLRGKGLWIGLVTGSTVQALLFALKTSLTNWQKQVLIFKIYPHHHEMDSF